MSSLRKFVSITFFSFLLMSIAAWAQDEQTAPAPSAEDQQVQQQAPAPPAEDQQVQQQAPPPPPGQPAEPRNQQDPPGRVARLQYMSGSVSIQPHGTDDWVSGSLNRPLTTNDNVWTDKDSRAELNLGTGVIRMSSETSLTVTNVSDNAVQMELHQGTVTVRVRHLFDGEIYEVDTPNMAFTVQKNGEYRFDVDPNGDASNVTVWKGEGDATGNGPAVRVKSHERARFTNGTSLTHEVASAPALDGFDDWCQVRDQREDHSISARYVAPGVIGSEDLDQYGTWREVAPYGPVWAPSGVAAGWSPYSMGHWVWISPWGWTWVDDAPWGFAPYHYGRWVYTGGFWGWAPGPYYYRPFYAPALVGWFGGAGWGVGLGFGFGGGIGWCPLGWGEPFLPWYHVSRGYFEHVNIYNTRFNNFNRFSNSYWNGGRGVGASFHYANLRAPGGAIAVSQRTLTNSLSVRSNMVRVPASRFEGASLGGRVGVTPGRTSMLGANAGRPAAGAPARSFARPVVSRMSPPAGARANAGVANSGSRMGANGGFNAAGRGPEGHSAISSGAALGRTVPRPPQSGAVAGRSMTEGANRGAMVGRSSVPRPPEGRTMGSSSAGAGMNRSTGSQSVNRSGGPAPSLGRSAAPNMNRSVPHPPESARSMPQGRSSGGPSAPRGPNGGSSAPNHQSQPSGPRSSDHSSPGRAAFVPRPSGTVRPATNYQADGSRSSYSSAGRSQGYGSSGYSAAASRESYGNGRSYGSSPSYGGRSYSQPSYGGGRSYSQPSYGGGRSYGGGYSASSGRGYSAPSYRASTPSSHGSSGGGGHSYSGGGGGGHSSGGGHGHGR